MFVFFAISLPLLSSAYLICKSRTPNIIYTYVSDKVLKVNTSTRILKLRIYKQLFYMCCHVMYINLLQYFNSTVIKTKNNEYELSYIINNRLYKIRITPDKNPDQILLIYNESLEDVTDRILLYMGPNYDWHNIVYKPSYFGYKTLTFQKADGEEYTLTN